MRRSIHSKRPDAIAFLLTTTRCRHAINSASARKNRPEMKKRPQRASGTSNLVLRAGVQPLRRAIRALEQTPAAVAGIGGRCTRWLEKSMIDGCLRGFRSEAEDRMVALTRVNRMTRIVGDASSSTHSA
ncbi:hypothetical protein ACEPUD_02570 [Burkholderia ubonensis]|uniref:hypothetical protein n=1 Tax=Burkholderia ubonensis TaxID=101571 RepID=UPI00358E3570